MFLAAAVPAKPGESVLELGCGAGVALLCLGARVAGLTLAGLERAPEVAELARANADRNGLSADIVTGDLAHMPSDLRDRSFDHVIMNPPFFAAGTSSADATRRASRHEETPLAAWVDAGLRRLVPGGSLTLIARIERLPDCLAGLGDRAGGVAVIPLVPRSGRAPKLFILGARKGARAPFRLAPPLVLHEGDSHHADGDDYTAEASAILREGAKLAR